MPLLPRSPRNTTLSPAAKGTGDGTSSSISVDDEQNAKDDKGESEITASPPAAPEPEPEPERQEQLQQDNQEMGGKLKMQTSDTGAVQFAHSGTGVVKTELSDDELEEVLEDFELQSFSMSGSVHKRRPEDQDRVMKVR